MYPGMMAWWKRARRAHWARAAAGCSPGGAEAGCGPGDWEAPHEAADLDDAGGFGGFGGLGAGGGAFGVRRPLRFLAFKLGLSEPQVAELARVLNELKTERAQAAVDHRRSTAAFADALAQEAFDEARVTEAATERVRSAERLRDALVKALGRIHAMLDARQRAMLAYLIRTGAIVV